VTYANHNRTRSRLDRRSHSSAVRRFRSISEMLQYPSPVGGREQTLQMASVRPTLLTCTARARRRDVKSQYLQRTGLFFAITSRRLSARTRNKCDFCVFHSLLLNRPRIIYGSFFRNYIPLHSLSRKLLVFKWQPIFSVYTIL